ncbi:MAG: FecR domain-containing protein [Pseudomonadota bacterium]
MPPKDISDPEEARLAREAARIFLTLEERPDDPAALARRDAFLSRGEAARRIYRRSARAWGGGLRQTRKRRGAGLLVAGLLILSGYAGFDRARVALFADAATSGKAEALVLASGDRAALDAASALIDQTEGETRRVVLMEGAGFFEVSGRARPFEVEAGALRAHVLGTAFEVAHIGGALTIAVAEGRVEARLDRGTWELGAGERLVWRGEGQPQINAVEPASIAAWRTDRLVVDGMTLAEVAAIIDRRLPGRIVIWDRYLAASRVSGAIELSDPLRALRILAASRGAEILAAPPLVTLITAGR